MTNNITVTAGSGTTIATDNVGGVNYQQIKMQWGAVGTITDVATATPMPVVAVSPVPTIATGTATAHSAVTTAYNATGQIWAANTSGSTVFQTISVAKAVDQPFTIIGGFMLKSGTVTTNALFRLHLFNAAPTSVLVDRGTWQGGVTLANKIGQMDVNINDAGSDVSFGSLAPSVGTVICGTPVSGAQTLYYAIEVKGSYTPVASETLTPILYIQ